MSDAKRTPKANESSPLRVRSAVRAGFVARGSDGADSGFVARGSDGADSGFVARGTDGAGSGIR